VLSLKLSSLLFTLLLRFGEAAVGKQIRGETI
jgi:hypothetical protein